MNRWSTIQLVVSKFQGYYNQINGRNQSGTTEQDKVTSIIILLLLIINIMLIVIVIDIIFNLLDFSSNRDVQVPTKVYFHISTLLA